MGTIVGIGEGLLDGFLNGQNALISVIQDITASTHYNPAHTSSLLWINNPPVA
ncbi:MAG: hypothetical protein RLP02_06210 [Coleofasciculus sp. C2-GNP5-27]